MAGEPTFQITLGDFSGPLDLLCHLVESSAIDVSSVRLTDVLSQYVSYLLTTKRASLAELAEFFSMASRLLIRKVRSLLPRENEPEDAEPATDGDAPDDAIDDETLAAMLERFKPYRSAAMLLDGMKSARERSFVRISDEGGPPWYDIGDLYGLSSLWWNIMDEYYRFRASSTRDGFMMDIPDAAPEEVLVERRMEDICVILSEKGRTSLSKLLECFGGGLIVTLLALLELSRLDRLGLSQASEWGDVEVEPN